LLTRGDIQSFQIHVWKTFFRYTENRSILEATINVEGKQTVTMFITHLSLNPLIQLKQVNFILNLSCKCPGPVLIAGDCNMRPGSRPWRRMNAHYADVWHRNNGCGYTYPSRRPRMRLDYIFADKAFSVLDARVVRTNPLASDHLPVQAMLQLP
jgi:endonuclease/exonuclease/phosphatase family metal-dependent hydrolase